MHYMRWKVYGRLFATMQNQFHRKDLIMIESVVVESIALTANVPVINTSISVPIADAPTADAPIANKCQIMSF